MRIARSIAVLTIPIVLFAAGCSDDPDAAESATTASIGDDRSPDDERGARVDGNDRRRRRGQPRLLDAGGPGRQGRAGRCAER